jgi:hypothetical protein
MKSNTRPSPYPFRIKPETRQWLDAIAQKKRRSIQVQLDFILDIVKEMEKNGEFKMP